MDRQTPHILGINPWIHDFAAYDFWARPLGLFSLLAILRRAGFRASYYDCLGRSRGGSRPPGRFGCGPYRKTRIANPPALADVARAYSRYGTAPEQVRHDLQEMDKPDLVLVTSLMTYWYPGVFEAIAIVRETWPEIPVLLGGTYATLCQDHARRFSGADEVITGPADASIVDLVCRRTGWRDVSAPALDSPDSLPFPALDLEGAPAFAPLLTSRGCPFRCAYCASGYLHPGFSRRSPESVFAEIVHWSEGFGVRDFVFYDDALLVDPENHILPLLEKARAYGRSLRFHTPNAVHIRLLSARVARAMFDAGFQTLRLGLETAVFANRNSLDAKVTREEFAQGAASLREAGFDRSRVGAYLLVGLPGQDYGAVRESIRIAKEAGMRPIPAHYTPIPHTALWEEAKKSSRYDLEADPVCTNNAAFPCQKEPFDWEKLSALKQLCLMTDK